MTAPRLRVVQWATGNIGLKALAAVVDHPALDLACVHSSTPAKQGLDAGALIGRAPLGVPVVGTLADVLAIPADCVLYMRQGTDADELCALLAAGRNVVTTRGDFHHPASMPPALRQRIAQACATGGSSIYSTGSSPGFSTEALLAPLLSLSRRLDCVTIDEYADLSSRNSPQLLFQVMGFGQPLRPFDPGRAAHIRADFAASLAQTADAVGLSCDEFTADGAYAAAAASTRIAAGSLAAGTIAAQRITVTGLRQGRPRFRFRANWYCSRELDQPDWDLRPSGWRVRVEGDTPLDVGIGFPVAPEAYAAFTPGLTAHRAVNAIHALCAAPPGIRTTADLPPILPLFAA